MFVPAVMFAVALASRGAAQEPAPTAGSEAARWLAGCWELRRGDRVTLEMWMPPAGGMMLGASRTVAGESTREYEQLMIREVGSRLVYTARPSGQAEASFTSTEVSDLGFIVENPDHDFPQRILYRRVGADSLVARVEGPGPTGVRGFELRMGRVECVSPSPPGQEDREKGS